MLTVTQLELVMMVRKKLRNHRGRERERESERERERENWKKLKKYIKESSELSIHMRKLIKKERKRNLFLVIYLA
jgi:hypothetical protein